MTTDRPFALLGVLQLADGLFPSGGFAHSLGLETYVQEGRVQGPDDVAAFIVAHLEGSAGPADAVAAARASDLARAEDVAAWQDVDARLEAMKAVPELRAASRQMGRQTLRAAAAGGDRLLADLLAAVDAGRTPGHHAAAFGAALGRSGGDALAAATAYLYSTAALLVGAALRLSPLGQLEGQRILARLRSRIAGLATRAADCPVEAMWSWSPGLELAALRHATLATRLFRS